MLRRLTVLAVVLAGLLAGQAHATELPPGFAESTVWSGLGTPTVIRFAPDGQVFVATKAGVVWQFDSLADPTPTKFADLSTEVFNGWDRGMLGMALDPDFANGRPYVYVSYAYDKAPGGLVVPAWGDDCMSPDDDGCAILGRVSR